MKLYFLFMFTVITLLLLNLIECNEPTNKEKKNKKYEWHTYLIHTDKTPEQFEKFIISFKKNNLSNKNLNETKIEKFENNTIVINDENEDDKNDYDDDDKPFDEFLQRSSELTVGTSLPHEISKTLKIDEDTYSYAYSIIAFLIVLIGMIVGISMKYNKENSKEENLNEPNLNPNEYVLVEDHNNF